MVSCIDFCLDFARRMWLLPLFGCTLGSALCAAPLPSPTEPVVTRRGYTYVRFPVSWELMRSGFNALDVALETESYAEYWALLTLSDNEIELLTPRGRTRVIGIQSEPSEDAVYPDILVVNEAEFARLLGLEPDPLGSLDKWLFIDLPARDIGEQNFTLKASPKYFVSVQLTINY